MPAIPKILFRILDSPLVIRPIGFALHQATSRYRLVIRYLSLARRKESVDAGVKICKAALRLKSKALCLKVQRRLAGSKPLLQGRSQPVTTLDFDVGFVDHWTLDSGLAVYISLLIHSVYSATITSCIHGPNTNHRRRRGALRARQGISRTARFSD